MNIVLALVFLVAQNGPAASLPQRPPDGTYTYALAEGKAPIYTSTIVVKSNGSTFNLTETVQLPNRELATAKTTWSSATLLPLNYEVHQGAIDLRATITLQSATFTGPPLTAPLSYKTKTGTKFMLVYDGLNAFRIMLPYVIAAHPNQTFTVAQINGNQTELGGPSTSSPPPGGKPEDTVSVVTLGDEQIGIWLNLKTGIVDEERVSTDDASVTLVTYVAPL